MFKLLALALLTTLIFAAESEKPSLATQIYEASVSATAGKAAKAYSLYTKELESANKEVLKSLEAAKADLNSGKKYNFLTVQQKSNAIEELDAKITEIKKGFIGDWIAKGGEDKGNDVKVLDGVWSVAYVGADTRTLIISNGKAYFKDNPAYIFVIKYDSKNNVFFGKCAPSKFETYVITGDSLTICHWAAYSDTTFPKVPHTHDASGKRN